MSRAVTSAGAPFVPLEEQDPTTWDRALIDEGGSHLRRASSAGRLGRFTLEAAIQAVHLARARTGATDVAALRTLHAALDVLAPTLGAKVALAATTARSEGPAAGLAALDALAAGHPVAGFQPYWAARGHLLAAAHRPAEAAAALRTAAALTPAGALRDHLESQRRRHDGT